VAGYAARQAQQRSRIRSRVLVVPARARERKRGLRDIFNWLVNDVLSSGSLSTLHTPIDADCEPMDFYLPSAQRNTVVISPDGATFEYFEVRAKRMTMDSLPEHSLVKRAPRRGTTAERMM